MDELRLIDYINKPASELVEHPSYSKHAHRVAMALLDFNTTQLENLDIPGVING